MSHFFITSDQITGNELTITGDDVNHMKNVLRMRSGEAFTAADENGMFVNKTVSEFMSAPVTRFCIVATMLLLVCETKTGLPVVPVVATTTKVPSTTAP